MDDYSNYIALSRYARYRDDLGRRETWDETVARLINFWKERHPELADKWQTQEGSVAEQLFDAISKHEVMPSMRTLMTAGAALDRDNVAGYNCSYLPLESPRDFDEMLYILMCGTGVGYSVESKYVSQLPIVPETFHPTDSTIVVSDSKIGWASSFRELLAFLWAGKVPKWDVSRVRAAGERLKTFGGRASGPEPLDDLFNFAVAMFKRAHGRKLTTLEAHDLACKIADVVVVGGVRRSALISLCDLGDDSMRLAKSGNWWVEHPHRALANISAVYDSKPPFNIFLKEWHSLYDSHSGERGIFSRVAASTQAAKNGRRDTEGYAYGTNPCSEIILRPRQFCNLSEVVIRADDNLDTLRRKVRLASVLGTLQSTLTNFRYLRKEWQRNTEEERLLGVSLTGICDHEVMGDASHPDLPKWLEVLKNEAISTNKEWAERLGIQQSVAVTCVKPSGTVSQLVNSASGIHPRFAKHYIRAVRADNKDPLARFMIDKGFPYEVDKMKPMSQYVFYFPQKAPEGCRTAGDMNAFEQLALWQVYQKHWCEHKPSVTIYYRDKEFMRLGSEVYTEFDSISGISFLPYSEHSYDQAPYTEVDEAAYLDAQSKMPAKVDWSEAAAYDAGTDNTIGMQTLACQGGTCDLP